MRGHIIRNASTAALGSSFQILSQANWITWGLWFYQMLSKYWLEELELIVIRKFCGSFCSEVYG
jgi:hypothetical protein